MSVLKGQGSHSSVLWTFKIGTVKERKSPGVPGLLGLPCSFVSLLMGLVGVQKNYKNPQPNNNKNKTKNQKTIQTNKTQQQQPQKKNQTKQQPKNQRKDSTKNIKTKNKPQKTNQI